MIALVIGTVLLLYLFLVEKANVNNLEDKHKIMLIVGIGLILFSLYKQNQENMDTSSAINVTNNKITLTVFKNDINTSNPMLTSGIDDIVSLYKIGNTSVVVIKKTIKRVNIRGDGVSKINYMLVGGGGSGAGQLSTCSSTTNAPNAGGGAGGEVVTGEFIPQENATIDVNIGAGGMPAGTTTNGLPGQSSSISGLFDGTSFLTVIAKGGNGASGKNGGVAVSTTTPMQITPLSESVSSEFVAKQNIKGLTAISQKKTNGGSSGLKGDIGYNLKINGSGLTKIIPDSIFGSGGSGGGQILSISNGAGVGGKKTALTALVNAKSGINNTGCGGGGERQYESAMSAELRCAKNNASGGSGVLVFWF